MTRVVTASTDTITLNGADIAEAIDQFVRRCHQDLDAAHGTRPYTLVTPPGEPVAHFDVRFAVDTFDTGAPDFSDGTLLQGLTIHTGDRFLCTVGGDGAPGIWVVDVAGVHTRATDGDTYQELVLKPYVRVTAGDHAGKWFLLDDDTITNIADALYNDLSV